MDDLFNNSQLDLFAAAGVEPVAPKPPSPPGMVDGYFVPPEGVAIKQAMARGDLRAALDIMGGLRKADLEKALLGAGFGVPKTKTRGELFAVVQAEMLEKLREAKPVELAQHQDSSGLPIDDVLFRVPDGWNGDIGGLIASNDPIAGGIIDQAIATREWFAIANHDEAGKLLEGKTFASQKEAFEALQEAVRSWERISNDPFAEMERLSAEALQKDQERLAQERVSHEVVIAVLDNEIKRLQDSYAEFDAKQYKKNSNYVEFAEGDHPGGQVGMSVTAINEAKKRNTLEAISNQTRQLEAIKALNTTPPATTAWISKLSEQYRKTQASFAKHGDPWMQLKSADALFEASILDDMGFRGPGGKGNVMSNDVSRLLLIFAKDEMLQKTAAQQGHATSVPGQEITTQEKVARSVDAPSPRAEAPGADRIEDYGQKIGGARKDLWGSFQRAIDEPLPADVASLSLSKHFPEPNYAKLLEGGVDVKVLAMYKALRDEIPTKPKRSYALKTWAENFRALHETAGMVLSGRVAVDDMLGKLRVGGSNRLTEIAERADLYTTLGYPDFTNAKGIGLNRAYFSSFWSQGMTEQQNDVYKWVYRKDDRSQKHFDSRDDALKAIRATLDKEREAREGAAQEPGKGVKFDLYRVGRSSKVTIGKKIAANKYIDLKTFDSVAEARAYLAANQQALEADLARLKSTPFERRAVNSERTGPDRRVGNVTVEEFAKKFGFQGRIEFGNTMPQSERQQHLNRAWDAFMDLAQVMNIPPAAISLNGTLGIGFGSRGTGGVNAAAAHFEPAKIAINLTRNNGSGSLGHEFWHALDNHFSRAKGHPSEYVTRNPNAKVVGDGAIRPEMDEAFKRVNDAIFKTKMVARSDLLDERRSKPYWGTAVEMSARAFERFLIDKAERNGVSNDYLANIVSHDVWTNADRLARGETLDTYPYPTDEEAIEINQAFQGFANALLSRSIDGREQLYSVGDGGAHSSVEEVEATLRGHPELGALAGMMIDAGLVRVDAHGPVDRVGEGRVQGFTAGDGVAVLCADGLAAEDATAVMLHEVFHAGVEPLIGSERWGQLMEDLGKLYDEAEHSGGPMGQVLREAQRRVHEAQDVVDRMGREREVEEFGAYAVELAEKAPPSLRRWANRLMGHVKAWALDKLGVQVGAVTPEQLRALAIGSMKAGAGVGPSLAVELRAAVAHSVAPVEKVVAEVPVVSAVPAGSVLVREGAYSGPVVAMDDTVVVIENNSRLGSTVAIERARMMQPSEALAVGDVVRCRFQGGVCEMSGVERSVAMER